MPCHAGKGFFLYTNGADPEFLVEDVPAAYTQLCADALNHMVDRTRAGLAPETGHTVTYGPCQFTLEQMQGGALNYARTCRVGGLVSRRCHKAALGHRATRAAAHRHAPANHGRLPSINSGGMPGLQRDRVAQPAAVADPDEV